MINYNDDKWFDELYDLAEYIMEDYNSVSDIHEDFKTIAYECELKPMVEFSVDWFQDRFDSKMFSEDGEDEERERLDKILMKCIDFDTLNANIPKAWYATTKKIIITKQDILDSLF